MSNFNIANVEISEVKETYERKPNRVIPGFVFCMTLLLVAMIVFGWFYKVESARTAYGIIVPKESEMVIVSNVSGIVDRICCTDGQKINANDTIIILGQAEIENKISELNQNIKDYLWQDRMQDMFLNGIMENKNPFSSDPTGAEYSYYIRFCLYTLDLQNENKIAEEKASSDLFMYSSVTLNTISAILEQRDEIARIVSLLESELRQLEIDKENCVVRAGQNGVITLASGMEQGTKLQVGMTIATIIPDTGNKVDIYVNNADILGINVGDEVKYHVISSCDDEQLWFGGRINKISSSAIRSGENYAGYFLVDGSLSADDLIDDKNERLLLPGIQVEVKIITQRISLLHYFLTKINLL